MEQTQAALARQDARIALRLVGLAVLLAIGSVWSVRALAATDSMVDKELSSDLQRFEIATETLSVVGLADSSPVIERAEPLDSALQDSSTVAPVLLLTPRLNTIVRDVFELRAGDRRPDDSALSDPDAAADDNSLSVAPVADGGAPRAAFRMRKDASEPAPTGDEQVLPNFQRRMYRTDI